MSHTPEFMGIFLLSIKDGTELDIAVGVHIN